MLCLFIKTKQNLKKKKTRANVTKKNEGAFITDVLYSFCQS